MASRLADTIRESGIACDDYAPEDYGSLTAAYAQKELPIPAAVASCNSENDEDITFEVFASAEQAATFVAAKRRLLCASATSHNVAFDGFPYVDGGTWLVEPDDSETASHLARVVNASAANGGC
jgi:hypothetical protein